MGGSISSGWREPSRIWCSIMDNFVIRAENLGKVYKIGRQKKNKMFREVIVDKTKSSLQYLSTLGRKTNPESSSQVWALKDINFSINAGESVGIIGANGAGKSTLLKVLALITAPTTGKIRIRGRVGSLLEVGTGFHPELTGRENIYLNGAILGMKRKEISQKFDEIVAFSEIDKYLDTPVKHYSSGMRMRLAFSVAAHLDPEILLIDEVLAVGDLAFQKKSVDKMSNVVKDGRTVLFVSHNMGAVRALCQRAIYIDQGRIIADGDVDDVIDTYVERNKDRLVSTKTYASKNNIGNQILSSTVLNAKKESANYLPHNETFFIRVEFQLSERVSHTFCNFKLYNNDMDLVLEHYDFESNENALELRGPGKFVYDIKFPGELLPPGKYYLGYEISRLKKRVNRKQRYRVFKKIDHISPFEIFDNGSTLSRVSLPWKGNVHVPLSWEKVLETNLENRKV